MNFLNPLKGCSLKLEQWHWCGGKWKRSMRIYRSLCLFMYVIETYTCLMSICVWTFLMTAREILEHRVTSGILLTHFEERDIYTRKRENKIHDLSKVIRISTSRISFSFLVFVSFKMNLKGITSRISLVTPEHR